MREQRLVYLRRLGAEVPRPQAPRPPTRAERTEARTAAARADARRVRFVYEKLGAAAFLSHLDVIRALPRAFRRLELPLVYSHGFHPKPDLTFGPALSLGVGSLAEVLDVKIADDIDPDALLGPLSAGAQPGLRFVGGAVLGPEDAGITRVIDVARYAVFLARGVAESLGGEHGVRGRLRAALDAGELPVVRRIDGIGKRVNVREFLRTIEVARPGGDTATRAGVAGDLLVLEAEVDIRGSGGVKIAEVVEAVFGDAALPFRAVRTALGRAGADGSLITPLELGRLRTPRASALLERHETNAAV
jgi:radical SAM-linked protein